jgi:hypothetical protein
MPACGASCGLDGFAYRGGNRMSHGRVDRIRGLRGRWCGNASRITSPGGGFGPAPPGRHSCGHAFGGPLGRFRPHAPSERGEPPAKEHRAHSVKPSQAAPPPVGRGADPRARSLRQTNMKRRFPRHFLDSSDSHRACRYCPQRGAGSNWPSSASKSPMGIIHSMDLTGRASTPGPTPRMTADGRTPHPSTLLKLERAKNSALCFE